MNGKLYTLILTTLIGGFLCAEAEPGKDEGKRDGRPPKGQIKQQMLKEFDADGDGKLSESERAAAKAAMEERKGKIDTNGDGTISEEERQAAQEARREQMRQKMDTDGDGTVSDAEREAARKEMREEMRKRIDTDGDGEISEAERQAAREARRGKKDTDN